MGDFDFLSWRQVKQSKAGGGVKHWTGKQHIGSVPKASSPPPFLVCLPFDRLATCSGFTWLLFLKDLHIRFLEKWILIFRFTFLKCCVFSFELTYCQCSCCVMSVDARFGVLMNCQMDQFSTFVDNKVVFIKTF